MKRGEQLQKFLYLDNLARIHTEVNDIVEMETGYRIPVNENGEFLCLYEDFGDRNNTRALNALASAGSLMIGAILSKYGVSEEDFKAIEEISQLYFTYPGFVHGEQKQIKHILDAIGDNMEGKLENSEMLNRLYFQTALDLHNEYQYEETGQTECTLIKQLHTEGFSDISISRITKRSPEIIQRILQDSGAGEPVME